MGSRFWNFLLITSESLMIMDTDENDIEMSAYEKIRMDNIKERQKMLENLKIEDEKENCLKSSSVRKYDKRKAKTVNKSVKRKSVRIAEKRNSRRIFCQMKMKM